MKDNKFIKINLNLFQDDNLNNTERIIISYIKGFPDGYFSTITFMAEILGQSRRSISKSINSLIEKGYIERDYNEQNILVFRVGKKFPPNREKSSRNREKSSQEVGNKFSPNWEKSSQGVGKKFSKSGKKVPTNNIYNKYYNISDKIVIPETEQKTEQTNQVNQPSIIDVFDYFLANGFKGSAQRFYDHYSKYGWKYNGQPLDWKDKALEWSNREQANKCNKSKASYDIDEYTRRALMNPLVYESKKE